MTPDGTLYGNVAERLLEGVESPVFIPSQPYGGTLKSLLVAPLAAVMDPASAFALFSVLVYAVFVGALYRLTVWLFGGGPAVLAGLYAAFAPVFVTRYSLNNDGTYVEVLALGTLALWLAARWTRAEEGRAVMALVAGVLLGLAFWLHILAVIHLAAVAGAFVLFGLRHAPRSLAALAAGWGLGAVPALLWNAANQWRSFENFVPGKARGVDESVGGVLDGLGEKALLLLTGDLPVLMGYDQGYGAPLDRLFVALGWLGVDGGRRRPRLGRRSSPVRQRSAPGRGAPPLRRRQRDRRARGPLHVPGNPRYLITLMSVLPAFIAATFGTGWRRLDPRGAHRRLGPGRASPSSRPRWRGTHAGAGSWRSSRRGRAATATPTSTSPPGSTSSRPEGHLLLQARPLHHRVHRRLPPPGGGRPRGRLHHRQPPRGESPRAALRGDRAWATSAWTR